MENAKPLARPLLILDLDEALVHAIDTEDKDPKKNQPIPGLTIDFWVGKILVYKRPHLDEFLKRVWKKYDVAVWSSGGRDYVERTVAVIMKGHPAPLFVWSSNKCTRRVAFEPYYREYNIKNLQKLWKLFDKNRMLIVDDTPEKSERNYGNAVYIEEFVGDQADEELLHLADYLDSLADEPNFRKIEKRGWRKRF